MPRRLSHVIGFDDAPFSRDQRGNILVVGAVYAGTRLEGVISGHVRRDGANSTSTLMDSIAKSRFAAHLHAVLLQGIALAGFNVVDIPRLHRMLSIPVIAVARKPPNMEAIRSALLNSARNDVRRSQGFRKRAVYRKTLDQ